MSIDLKERIHAEQITNLFAHTYTITASHPIAGGILVITFWGSVAPSLILSWLAILVAVSLARIPVYIFFKRANKKLTDYLKWRVIFYILSALQGCVYAIAFVTLPFLAEQHLHSSILVWMFTLTGCSVVGYVSDMKGLMCFFVPCILPGTISLVAVDGISSLWMAMAILLYSATMIKMVIPVHKSIVNAMRLNYTLESEIETRKIIEEKLHKLAIEDALTGAYNRRFFDKSLESEINSVTRLKCPLCLVLIDIDHFKQYNDFYGHQQGDECLKIVVKVLKRGLRRDGDILARYGGEEFAIILPNMDQSEATILIENLLNELEKENLEHKKTRVKNSSIVTISAGIVQFMPQSEVLAETLIKQADSALYDAKSNGRNCVVCFSEC